MMARQLFVKLRRCCPAARPASGSGEFDELFWPVALIRRAQAATERGAARGPLLQSLTRAPAKLAIYAGRPVARAGPGNLP